MKKTLFTLFTLLLLVSCGKENDIPPVDTPSEGNSFLTEENIYKETGCRPKEIKSIKKMWLFVDSVNNEKYLYGSKTKGDIESFWVAKFTSQGEQIWEIIKEQENYISNAFNPNVISSGNIVFSKVLRVDDFNLMGVSPVIVDSKDGKANFIKVFDGYFYTDVNVFENFFFCSISQNELDKLPNAKMWFAQIDNNGNILNQDGEMNIPEKDAVWKDNDAFITVSPTSISKKNILINRFDLSWDYAPDLPSYEECVNKVIFDKDTVIITYALKLTDGNDGTYTYKLSYTTGKSINDNPEEDNPEEDNPGENKYLDLEKSYIAPDSMTVTVRSIDVSSNEQGTIYYTINYTLENRTKDMIITEGTFEALFFDNQKGEYQTGFFGKLYPGESISRAYTFRSLGNKPYYFIQYKHDWMGSDGDILKKSLKWKVAKQ